MKARLSVIAMALLLSASCAKRKFYKQIEGDWMTYEIVKSDGTLYTGTVINAMSVFGVYAPGVRFKSDKTFVPFLVQMGEKGMKEEEGGKYTYYPKSFHLDLSEGSLPDVSYLVEKLDGDLLWLKGESTGDLIRTKRAD